MLVQSAQTAPVAWCFGWMGCGIATCASIMHAQAVPIAVISAWLGHADPAFTMRTYVHAQNDALKTAAASLEEVVTRS